MPIRTVLMACVLALRGLPAITAAYAGDPYGGFGPSDGASQEVGSNPVNAVPAQEDVQPCHGSSSRVKTSRITVAPGTNRARAPSTTAPTLTMRAATSRGAGPLQHRGLQGA
jgi:hypothetical protein